MAMAFRFSARAGLCPPQDAARVQAHLAGLGYRLHPQAFGITAAPARLVEHMAQDKKVQDGRLTFILARGIGQSFVARNIPAQDVEAFLREDI
jgi:3-dehydroquinate synthetase